MKKIIKFLSVLLTAVVLVGCSNGTNDNNKDGKYDLIYECSNEMACYNVLKYAKALKLDRYEDTMSDEDKKSFKLISGHGDVCAEAGTGTIYISYSFNNSGSQVQCNESYEVRDYGIQIGYYSSSIAFKSDESVCPNVDKNLSSYINIKQVNYFFDKYQDDTLNYEKAKFNFIFKNEDGSLLGEKSIEGYGSCVVTDDITQPTKEGNKEYYYTFYEWKEENGRYFDMIARKSATLIASFRENNVKYSLKLLYPDGTEMFALSDKYNYNSSIRFTLGGTSSIFDTNVNIPYNSWDLMPVNGDTYYLFTGWKESELIDHIERRSSMISGARDVALYSRYYLKPLEDNIVLTSIFEPQSVYDYEELSDGKYKATLYNNLLYEDGLYVYDGKQRTIVLPSKAFRFDENGNRIEYGDVVSIGKYSFSLFDDYWDYSRGSNDNISVIYIPKSITSIEEGVFFYCKGISKIVYEGSQQDWEKISVGSFNDDFLAVSNIVFNTSYDSFISNK